MSPASAGRVAAAAVETLNILLTTDDARIATTPKDVVWTHRTTTLYRYRSADRRHAIPVLLVFALINRPHIFDLRPGHSFVEYLLGEGFDVYLLDWGQPGPEDADTGLEYYVCDALPWAMREVKRSSGAQELTLVGWCIGGTLCTMHAALEGARSPARNLVLLTTPIDTTGSLYRTWIGGDSFDVEHVTDGWPAVPGVAIDVANKLMKPVTNLWTTYRRLGESVYDGTVDREAYQSMAKWIADNPAFPARAFREWVTWLYKQNRLVRGHLRLRGRRVELARIEQSLLVVTAGADHIAPPTNSWPLLDMTASSDVEHLDRPGGHIGLMAGSKARKEVWPDVAAWLGARSGTDASSDRPAPGP
ncbi:MAG: alpha/beta fold hydrolase [Solirubrobacterales bacterium]|nr:alpha/beta fold hydrolase [Solirubrobacterales bacterium]